MSLVYTQTATPPSPSHPSFPAPAPDFLATLKGLSALPGFLLRLEFGKQAGDICSFSNSIHLPIHSFLQQRFAKWVSDPMRPQGELGPAPSSGRPGVSAGPQLCSKVPSGKWLDARGLQLPPHPMLVSPRPLVQGPPPRSFVSDGKEGHLPVSTALVPEGVCPVWWPGARRVGRTCGCKGEGHSLRTPFAASTGISWEKGLQVVGIRVWQEMLLANIPPEMQPGRPQLSSCCPDQNVPFSPQQFISFQF